MTIDTNQFLNLLATSQLIPADRLPGLLGEFQTSRSAASNSTQTAPASTELAQWMVERNLLTEFQSAVLLNGESGPFRFANYLLTDRFSTERSQFLAVHRPTNHPVLLEFFAGDTDADLAVWRSAEAWIEQTSSIQSHHLITVHQTIIMPQFRFAAMQRPVGVSLSERLPHKGRLPWENCCLIFSQIAAALNTLHQRGFAHGAVSPRTIWLAKNGFAQLRWQLQPDTDFANADPSAKGIESRYEYLAPEATEKVTATPSADVYALGCTLFRAVAGRSPFSADSVKEIQALHKAYPRSNLSEPLSKYELPMDMTALIVNMLAIDSTQRPQSLLEIQTQLELLGGKTAAKLLPAPSVSWAAYDAAINQFKPGSEAFVESVPPIVTDEPTGSEASFSLIDQATAAVASAEEDATKRTALKLRGSKRKSKWQAPVAVAVGLLALVSAICIFAMLAANQPLPTPTNVAKNGPTPDSRDLSTNDTSANPNRSATANINSANSNPLEQLATLPPNQRPVLLQQLIDDDRQTLWESPTLGAPLELFGLPPAPKLIFAFRPAEILADSEGPRLLQSLGPEFSSLVSQFQSRCGLSLNEIEQVIISLHTNANFEYEPFFVVTPTQPMDIDHAMQLWQQPAPQQTINGQSFYVSHEGEQGFYLLPAENLDSRETTDNPSVQQAPDSVSRFAFGPPELIIEVASNHGSTLIAGAIATLAQSADNRRQVNILFLRSGLFNDEGQQLMGPRLRDVNRELSIMIPDEVQGGLFSLHLDHGTFIELMLNRTLDIEADELSERLSKQLRNQRDRLTQFITTIPASPYWDRVRLKYDNMLADLFRQLRWGVEHGEVVANGWLPPMAAHNLLAASELVISFAGGAIPSDTAKTNSSGPQTLTELLATKRDLKIANPPDLNLLIADLEAEINEDHPGLPFKFNIRLLGGDLEAEGITKNQRPGELNLEQQTLGEILTSIMTSANPSKDITGPADPACKLIWVIADNPDQPGSPAILITTRNAAKKKSYQLPPAFLGDEQ